MTPGLLRKAHVSQLKMTTEKKAVRLTPCGMGNRVDQAQNGIL
jgi:hypothetical protein